MIVINQLFLVRLLWCIRRLPLLSRNQNLSSIHTIRNSCVNRVLILLFGNLNLPASTSCRILTSQGCTVYCICCANVLSLTTAVVVPDSRTITLVVSLFKIPSSMCALLSDTEVRVVLSKIMIHVFVCILFELLKYNILLARLNRFKTNLARFDA